MVDVGQKYNLNHIYDNKIYNDTIAVGTASIINSKQVELFQKSLALTSDLKRLPVLRSLSLNPDVNALILARMVASGITVLKMNVIIYNMKLTDEEIAVILADEEGVIEVDRIWAATIVIWYNAAVGGFIQIDNESWSFLGGKLLNDTITLVAYTQTNQNVAGANFNSFSVGFTTYMEVDWVPVSKAEFQEFIMENIYVKD